MQKRLQPIGNSFGIIIEKPVLELLNIDRDTPLDVRTDGVSIILKPVRAAGRKERVRKSIEKVFTKHASTMEKLAK